MADGKGRKRQRLSGSDYKKLRLGHESSAAKQKDAILKFIKHPASDEAHNNHSKDSSSDSEDQNLAIEAKFGIEKESNYSDNKSQDDNNERQHSVDFIECVDGPSDISDGNIVQNSNDENAVGVDEGLAVVVEDNDFKNKNDMVSTDPSNWPVNNDRT